MAGVYLVFAKTKFLNLGDGGLVPSDAVKDGDWDECPEAARWKDKFKSKWHRLAENLTKWFHEVIMKGCSEKDWKAKLKAVKAEYGHRAAQEFVAVFPKEETVEKKPGKLTQALFDLGNKRKPGSDIDISAFI